MQNINNTGEISQVTGEKVHLLHLSLSMSESKTKILAMQIKIKVTGQSTIQVDFQTISNHI